jgi:hypothetical protein
LSTIGSVCTFSPLREHGEPALCVVEVPELNRL